MTKTSPNKVLSHSDRDSLKSWARELLLRSLVVENAAVGEAKLAFEAKARRVVAVTDPALKAAQGFGNVQVEAVFIFRHPSERQTHTVTWPNGERHWRVTGYDAGYTGSGLAEHDEVSKLFFDFNEAQAARKQKLEEVIAPYERLIDGSRTFNALAEVWPEVEAVRDRYVPKLLPSPSQADIRAIAADVARRKALGDTTAEA